MDLPDSDEERPVYRIEGTFLPWLKAQATDEKLRISDSVQIAYSAQKNLISGPCEMKRC